MKQKTQLTALENLQRQASNTLGFITSAIENLKTINTSIADEQEKNNAAILKLQQTNNSLLDLKNGNDKVISNFEKLLQ